MSGACIAVRPRSTKWIRGVAQALRDSTGHVEPWFPIVPFMDLYLTRELDGYQFEILPREELGNDAGRTYPDQRIVQIREDVYDGAVRGDGFGRFTMAHELGHLLLHQGVPLARHVERDAVKPYCNSEVQANRFAAELLMPVEAIRNSGGPMFIAEMFGVSNAAAEIRWNSLKEEGLLTAARK